MTSRYKLMSIDEVVPGMVLFDDCRDRFGKVLLAKGSVLDEGFLSSLRNQEFTSLAILSTDEVSTEEEASSQTERMQRLDVLFRKQNFGESQAYANKVLMEYLRRHRQGDPL